MVKKIINLVRRFIQKLNKDNISAFSAQSAFFFILSVFPLFMLILSIIKYTPLSAEHFIEFINDLFPNALANSFNNIIDETYEKSNIALISIAALTTLWTASKAVTSITLGFEKVYGDEKDKRGYFVVRLLSVFYTFIFIFSFVLTLALLVFGDILLRVLSEKSALLYDITSIIMNIRGIFVPLILILIFCGIYIISSPKKTKFKTQLPGAIFSSLGWIGFSYLFSFYVENFNNYSYIYGSITTIILLMIWTYICIYILFLGLEINIFLKRHFVLFQAQSHYRRN